MTVFFLPDFICDLQNHDDAHFARRVLKKTLFPNGCFRQDSDDHRYEGIDNAWIRYVSRGRTAYRVIYLRRGGKVFLYRAGEHSVEERLAEPATRSFAEALPVTESGAGIYAIPTTLDSPPISVPQSINRFKRNIPNPHIYREIISRRILPHKDIWLVSPFVNWEMLTPTSQFGKLLLDQAEDGASVVLITSPPEDKNIQLMEKLVECRINIFVYPRLHTKLYCFIVNERRLHEPAQRGLKKFSSLVLMGSANLTYSGISSDSRKCNEELCYILPEEEYGYIEGYITELMTKSYDMPAVRSLLARGQWQQLQKGKW